MLHNQSVNVHQFTSAEAAAPFTLNWLEPKFRCAYLALNVHMPRLSPIIRVKEQAIPALAENRWHLTSLPDGVFRAKP